MENHLETVRKESEDGISGVFSVARLEAENLYLINTGQANNPDAEKDAQPSYKGLSGGILPP
jgi:hypothetical protein